MVHNKDTHAAVRAVALGAKFTLTRLLVDIPGIILIAFHSQSSSKNRIEAIIKMPRTCETPLAQMQE
jgi:hypothetical protein